ncbi:MAG: tRNA lysidine(34) synthetase TilS, partial [Flavobacteriales bacterium]|nr:tRNA lysidine(34) synthetase TilS [Flavobacteriales bacterium]
MDHINTAQVPVSPSGKCLIAMSGGRDSMALAHYLSNHGISCIWAHCNFGLRGTESDEDEQFLRDQSKLMHAEILVKRFTRDDLDLTSSNIQDAARILRYSWFSELCELHDIPAVCTAHHQDDQAETVLLQIIRGAGLKGLSGMKPNDHGIHRPLLQVSRGEIDRYIEEHGIPFREDSSNAKNYYSRNRIRNEIMPLLNHINPKTSE